MVCASQPMVPVPMAVASQPTVPVPMVVASQPLETTDASMVAVSPILAVDADVSSASSTLPGVLLRSNVQATPPRSTPPGQGHSPDPWFTRAVSTQPVLQPAPAPREQVRALPLPTTSEGAKKFRSGAPPPAPPLTLTFQQCSHEPHSLRQWKRKVQAWELRATQYVPTEELGLLLLEALHGDSALLCQDLPLTELYTVNGVQRIMDQLLPLEQQRVHSFQQSMRAYVAIRTVEACTD
eukprot:5247810-Amphidinium_carterae.2